LSLRKKKNFFVDHGLIEIKMQFKFEKRDILNEMKTKIN